MQREIGLAAHNFVEEYRNNFRKHVLGATNIADLVFDIVPEPTNQYDRLALAVFINGAQIGYVSKKDQAVIQSLRPELFEKPTQLRANSWGVTANGEAFWVFFGLFPEFADPAGSF